MPRHPCRPSAAGSAHTQAAPRARRFSPPVADTGLQPGAVASVPAARPHATARDPLSSERGPPPPRFSPSKAQVLEMTSKSRSRPCAPAAPLGPDAASPWHLRRDPRVPSWAGAEPSVTQRLPSGYHQQHRGPPLTSPENKTSLPDQVEVSRHVARPVQRTPHAPRCR